MQIPFVTEYANYFSTLKKFAGKSLYLLMSFSLAVAITDGIGITMLLPLLKTVNIDDNESAGQDIFAEAFLFLNIPQTFGWVLCTIGGLFLVKGLIKYIEGYLRAKVRSQLFTKWRSELLKLYSSLDYKYYTSKNTGHFTNVINQQVGNASAFVVQYTQFSSKTITAFVYLILAIFLNWGFSLMAMMSGLITVFVLRSIQTQTKRISIFNALETGTLNKFLIQLLQSFKYLQATARFSFLEKSAIDSINKLSAYQFKIGKLSALLSAVQEPLAIAFMIGIMFYQVEILGEPLAPLLVVLVLFYRTMNTLMLGQSQWQTVMSLAGSLDVIVKEFNEVNDHQENTGKVSLQSFDHIIEFDRVDFSFNETPIIRNVSFSIPKNSTVALVGESGSGKTTLTDLISVLLKPSGGNITFDGINANRVDLQSWRNKIGFVSQDTTVFDDNIINNITLWEGDFRSDETIRNRVYTASQQAHCHDFITSFPEGYYTQIGERGVKLSGGQKQRLFIARELYKQPEILVLDEATSSLDSESERFIQESIDELKGKMTVIIIAHRLSTIKNVDKIIVIDKGQIKEEGSFEELTAIDSRFRQMAEYQKL